MPAQIETTWRSTGYGLYCGCLSSSTRRAPRSSWARDAASRSDAKDAKASRSRYWDRRELQAAGDLLHRLDLGVATDPGDRAADVDGRADTRVEQVGLQEDLPVGDGDDVGGDVRRDVVGLGLHDGQAGEGAVAHLLGELRAPLQQPRVQVEDVTGVGLAARWPAQQQGDRAVGRRLLGQVVEDDQHGLAVVHPVLAEGRPGVRRDVLVPGRVGSGRRRRSSCTPSRPRLPGTA